VTRRIQGRVFYGIVLAAALWLNSTFAQGGYEAIIHEACAYHGCDPSQLIRVVECETGGTWDYTVVGPNGERGLAQYHPASHNPAGYAAWADPHAQLWIMAADFAAGLNGMWVCT
jgi:hypothetical protein